MLYDIYFTNSFFYNFFFSLIFIIISLLFAHLFSINLNNKKIIFFEDCNEITLYFLIFCLYSVFFSIFFLFKIQKFIIFFVGFIIFIKIILSSNILLNKYKINYIDFKYFFLKNKFLNLSIILLLILFFFISVLPISDADSIAYHLNLIAHIFNYGIDKIDLDKNLQFSLLSNSEILLTFSIIFKSDNFGALLNLSTLILFIIFFYKKKKLSLILLLSCPLIIFLISTQKLQLFFGLLYLFLFHVVHENKIKNNLDIFLFSLLLIFFSSGKLSYVILCAPLYVYFVFKNYYKLKKIIFYGTISVFFIYFPILLMKFFLLENPFSPILTSFYSNNKEIFDSLTYNLRATQGWLVNPQLSDFLLPFFPIKISQLSASLGFIFLLTFFNFFLQKKLFFIPLITIALIISTGQLLPRYYLECFLVLTYYVNEKDKLLKFFSTIQFFFIIVLATIFIYISYFKNNVIISTNNYKINNAYSFANYLQLKTKDIDGNVLNLSEARPSIFEKDNTFSARYLIVKGNKEIQSDDLKEFINRNNIKYIISYKNLNIDNCIELHLFDKIEVFTPVRNFFYKNKPATHFIFELKNSC